MVPREDVWSSYCSALNGEGKLITVAGIGEEEQIAERHVKVAKVGIRAEALVVFYNSRDRPNKARLVLTENAVGLSEQIAELRWNAYAELARSGIEHVG